MGTPARDTRHDDAEDAYDRTLGALLEGFALSVNAVFDAA